MLRLTVILVFIFLNQLAYAASEVDGGRFEISESGKTYWLPSWLSKNIFYDFKNQLIESKVERSGKNQTANPGQCSSAYQKLYKKSDIHWSIFFGYGDGEGTAYTTDIAERDIVEKEITSRCPEFNPEIQFCGFKATDQVGMYIRELRTKDNTLVNIHLRLLNPSITSEPLKTAEEQKTQRRQSKQLEKSYIEALQTDDVVFYIGHSRHGAGPGFRPLVKKSKDWWIATLFRPMSNNVLLALNPNIYNNEEFPATQKTVNNPAVIGMFSCEAEAYFGYDFASNSDSGLILTRQSISEEDNLRLLYAASNALLAQECEEEIHSSMQEAIATVYYRKNEKPPTSFDKTMPKVFNFFHKDKVKYKNDLVLYFQNKGKKSIEIGPVR